MKILTAFLIAATFASASVASAAPRHHHRVVCHYVHHRRICR
jgi:hypothetical protein